MKLIAISGWNTPNQLISEFCQPITEALNIEFELFDYEGSQVSVDQQLAKFNQQLGNEKAIVFAWSLGGNLALKWQETNSNILSVISAATNLDFVDEEFGMAKVQFYQFCQSFASDNERMLARMQKKFMQLVLLGAKKEFSNQIKAVYDQLNVDVKTLHHSLLWLDQIKLNANNLNPLNQYWFADQDSLVPKQAAGLFENSEMFSGSHAFFLENPKQYQEKSIEHFKAILASING